VLRLSSSFCSVSQSEQTTEPLLAYDWQPSVTQRLPTFSSSAQSHS